MGNDDIAAKVADLRRHQRNIQAASAAQEDGWRYAVVTGRRNVGIAIGALSASIATRPDAASVPLRRAVSRLRAALAEHQALWPALSMDPADPSYIQSVSGVRRAYAELDTALAELDGPARSHMR